MRVRPRLALCAFLLLALAGCGTGPPTRGGNWLDRLGASQAALGPDGVLIDAVVLELPAGDAYLNEGLWACADEHIVPLEERPALEENGFRVGQVVGSPPERLQRLLGSDRTAVSRWRQIQPAGKAATLALGRTVPAISYQVAEAGEAITVELPQAQAFLSVVPSLAADGRTHLRITPEIHHGEVVPDFQVAPDRSGRTLSYRRRMKSYPSAGWEVTLAPNEYLIIGGSPDQADRLGHACFFAEDSGRRTQRLLVVRTSRGSPTVDETIQHTGPVPLAVQTNWGGGRQ